MIEGRKVLEGLKKLKDLTETARSLKRTREAVQDLLRKVVKLGSLPLLDPYVRITCDCYSYVKFDGSELVVETRKEKVTIRFKGYCIEVMRKDGATWYTAYEADLEHLTIADLLTLQSSEEKCGLISKLIEAIRRQDEKAKETLERLRKLVTLVEMALKS